MKSGELHRRTVIGNRNFLRLEINNEPVFLVVNHKIEGDLVGVLVENGGLTGRFLVRLAMSPCNETSNGKQRKQALCSSSLGFRLGRVHARHPYSQYP